jgi:hypothetical protein
MWLVTKGQDVAGVLSSYVGDGPYLYDPRQRNTRRTQISGDSSTQTPIMRMWFSRKTGINGLETHHPTKNGRLRLKASETAWKSST